MYTPILIYRKDACYTQDIVVTEQSTFITLLGKRKESAWKFYTLKTGCMCQVQSRSAYSV